MIDVQVLEWVGIPLMCVVTLSLVVGMPWLLLGMIPSRPVQEEDDESNDESSR